MQYILNYISNNEDLFRLKNYQSRDGFILIDKEELNEMLEYFQQNEIFSDLIPFLTDSNSNYWCFYSKGSLEGMVCYLSHDEINLEPKFKCISSLIDTIEENPDIYDFDEMNYQNFDFPFKELKDEFFDREKIISEIFTQLQVIPKEKEEIRQQLSFSLMVLVKVDEIENYIYPFLDDDDMYIQERAIDLIGFHKYKPAKEKLIELTKTALVNGRTAAGRALKRLNNF